MSVKWEPHAPFPAETVLDLQRLIAEAQALADSEHRADAASPSGEQLAGSADHPQASGDLYVMRADGTDVRALTDNQFEEATPGWAPVRRPGAR